MKTLKCKIYIN